MLYRKRKRHDKSRINCHVQPSSSILPYIIINSARSVTGLFSHFDVHESCASIACNREYPDYKGAVLNTGVLVKYDLQLGSYRSTIGLTFVWYQNSLNFNVMTKGVDRVNTRDDIVSNRSESKADGELVDRRFAQLEDGGLVSAALCSIHNSSELFFEIDYIPRRNPSISWIIRELQLPSQPGFLVPYLKPPYKLCDADSWEYIGNKVHVTMPAFQSHNISSTTSRMLDFGLPLNSNDHFYIVVGVNGNIPWVKVLNHYISEKDYDPGPDEIRLEQDFAIHEFRSGPSTRRLKIIATLQKRSVLQFGLCTLQINFQGILKT
ncbi:hypothetical protein K435DRAFT_842223 [Dendrothele bispora CBS 962.96]|uniref:Uncharacterized protein n=1 Tax=Dendrothele bispora (strain CBS 962.96) TaxID=1314807 RepID=A0A4S8LH83_DENBC|nr:hypothetical protein K435DRAFT_842223 [Dendrothele bispora CBS 962.96]